MERRTALAIAAAAAATVMAAGAAFAVNVGLLKHDTTHPVGVLDTSAIDATSPVEPVDPTVVTVIVEDPPVQASTPTGATSRPSTASDLAPAAAQVSHRGDDSTEVEHESDDSSRTDSSPEHGDDD